MAESNKKRKLATSNDESKLKRRHYCPHCKHVLSYSAYWSHRAKYYNTKEDSWLDQEESKGRITDESDSGDDFNQLSSDLEEVIPQATEVNCESQGAVSLGAEFEITSDLESTSESESSLMSEENDIDVVELFSESDCDDDTDHDAVEHAEELLEQGTSHCANSASNDDDEDNAVRSPMHSKWMPFLHSISVFLIKMQLVYRLPNAAIILILKLLKVIMGYLSSLMPDSPMATIVKIMPTSLYMAKKYSQLQKCQYKQYAVCPKCYALYDQSSFKMTEIDEYGCEVSKCCTRVLYPNHTQISKRKACDEILMKKVKYKMHKFCFKPIQTYCYLGIRAGITLLLNRPNFWENCNEWRRRTTPTDTYVDIFDGQVWKDFQEYQGKAFLKELYNLALMLNVDWFQPFDHTSYSLGVVYLVILNLPRAMRYKIENVILVGIIPGPHEPRGIINTFLGPMVQELLELWSGCWLGLALNKRFVRAALVCVSCDVPASRKVGGLVGFSALKGCSRCLKEFNRSHFNEKADYGGFDVDCWPKRSHIEQKEQGYKHLLAPTPTAQKVIEREFGVKYTVLFELPYYDSVRFLVIDPMHALFLGIAKHTFKVWNELQIVNEMHYSTIQSRVDQLIVPTTIGRIPLKLCAGFLRSNSRPVEELGVCIFTLCSSWNSSYHRLAVLVAFCSSMHTFLQESLN